MIDVRIEKMTREHADEWRKMRDAVYGSLSHGFHKEEMELVLQSPDRMCRVATGADNSVVGFVQVSLRNIVDGCLTSPVGFIEGIYVKPPYRGHGVAGRLVAEATKWSKKRGCVEMATDAELDNTDAHAFHKRMGFSETYRIVEFRKRIE